jgi:hypothetical protein
MSRLEHTINKRKPKAQTGGIGCLTVLFLIFLVLKLTDNIDWSWWIVTAPLWGPWALIAVVGVIAALIAIIAGIFQRKR